LIPWIKTYTTGNFIPFIQRFVLNILDLDILSNKPQPVRSAAGVDFTFELHKVHPGHKLDGHKSIKVQSRFDCENACRSDPQCVGYTMVIDECRLKAGNFNTRLSLLFYAAKCIGCKNFTIFKLKLHH